LRPLDSDNRKDDEISNFISELRPMYTATKLRRFGPAGDGGYVMFDDLDGIGGCVSLGVSFEAALMRILPI
jgi:hypothetical protein